MRMLAPLLQKSSLKREFRARINPKLVYHNLTALSEAGIVNEPVEGTFELSQLGKTVLPELIAFLEKTRKSLDAHRRKEGKSNGRQGILQRMVHAKLASRHETLHTRLRQ